MYRLSMYCSSMYRYKNIFLTLLLTSLLSFNAYATSLTSDPLVKKWETGLAGAKLTYYDGSVISSNSTLTVINFCKNGRYSYYKEGGWFVPGAATGTSYTTIYGQWNILQANGQVLLSYLTDQGKKGTFTLFLQKNGKVNVGGQAYAIQANSANCQ